MDKKLARTFFMCSVLFIFSIAGCANSTAYPVYNPIWLPPATSSPMAIFTQQTQTPSVDHSLTSTKISPTSTKSPILTDSPSPTLTQTLSIPVDKELSRQALTDSMLSRSDYLAFDDADLGYLAPQIFEIFFQEGAATITDASAELNPTCLLECTKQVWATASEVVTGFGSNEVTINRKVVVVMIRSKDGFGAQKTALNLYSEFLPVDFEYSDVYKNVLAPIENTSIGFDISNNRVAFILTTSVDSIAIWVMNYPHQLADDGVSEADIATYFANLQIMKLKNAGMVP